MPGPALQICGAREMCRLFRGVGVRCLSGRSLLFSFSDLPSPEFLFLIAAPGVKVRVGMGEHQGLRGGGTVRGDILAPGMGCRGI